MLASTKKSKLVGALLDDAAAALRGFASSPDAAHSTAAKDSGSTIQNWAIIVGLQASGGSQTAGHHQNQ